MYIQTAIRVLVYGLAVLCVATTIAPWSTATHWLVRVWDFPRLQQAVLALVTAAAVLVLDGSGLAARATVGLLLLAALHHLLVVLPYSPFWRKQMQPTARPAGERTLSLMVVNVLMDNREADRLLRIIEDTDPDVLLAVEVDDWWAEQLDELGDARPHRIRHPLPNTYGLAIHSRLPLVAPEVRHLLHEDIPSVRTGLQLASGELVRFYAIHPEPPSPTEATTSLGRDAELMVVGREIEQASEPAIVAGDLNDVGWSRTSRLFRRLSGLLDPRIGRGLFCTFNAKYPLLRWPLDHVFVSADFLVREIRRLPAFGSDHFPIFIELEYAPRAEALHEAPQADHADRVEAQATVAEAESALAEGDLQPARSQGG
jgi:endonuclease/exonuclease/phosphatase (EEP) superfamily protein YafD